MENMEKIAQIVDQQAPAIIGRWQAILGANGGTGGGRIKEAELQTQCREFLTALKGALASGGTNAADPGFAPVHSLLDGVSRSRALQGFSPS